MTSTPPPFDPELAATLAEALAGTGSDSIATGITPQTILAEREAFMAGVPTLAELDPDDRFAMEERTVPGPPDAPDVSVLIARPRTAEGVRPIVFHTHGGGLIMGNNRYGIESVLAMAEELKLVVVSVEYRLAPEHPFPAGMEDAYAGLRWTAREAATFSGDPGRIILVGGSAGGNLAAALALSARDRKEIGVFAQLLMYPMLDDRGDSVSARQMHGQGVWDDVSNRTGWDAWLGARDGEVSPYAAPARAQDLSGLPPAFLEVGSAETFRDEVVDYAQRIWAAGGSAELHVWPGGFHGFDQLAPQAAISRDAIRARTLWLKRLLGE